MAFFFLVGVYALAALGLLWFIERYRVTEWRFFSWLPKSGESARPHPDMGVHAAVELARDDPQQFALDDGCQGDMETKASA